MDREDCICKGLPVAVLMDVTAKKLQPIIIEGLLNGQPVRQGLLGDTFEMVRALSEGEDKAFDTVSNHFRHHLSDCPFSGLGPKDSLCEELHG